MHQTNEHGANTPLQENLSLLCRIAGERTVRDRVRSSIIEQLSSAYPSGEKIADLRAGTQEHGVPAREWKDIFDGVSGQYLEKRGHSYRIQGTHAVDLRGKFLQRSAQFRRMEALCDYFGIAISDPENLRQETEILTKNLLLPQGESETREGNGTVPSYSRLLIRGVTETNMKLYSVLTLLRAGGRLNLTTYSLLLTQNLGFGKDDFVHICAAISQMEADTHGAVSTALHNGEWMLEADPHKLREPLEESAAHYDIIAMNLAKISEEFTAKTTRAIAGTRAKRKRKTAAITLPVPEAPTKKLHLVRSRRLEQGIPVFAAARLLGRDVRIIRLQEQESTDLRISDLRAWQKALDVPLRDLILESNDQYAPTTLKRSQLMRIANAAQAIHEKSDSIRVKRMTTLLLGQLTGLMPELGTALNMRRNVRNDKNPETVPLDDIPEDDSIEQDAAHDPDTWGGNIWKGETKDTASFGQKSEHSQPPKLRRGALHRIQVIRIREGVSLRSAARHMMAKNIKVLRLEQQESTDLRISDLLLWQRALDVPLIELLENVDEQESEWVESRSKILLMMKTLKAIHETTQQTVVQKIAGEAMGELIYVMPELREVPAWHQFGQRRALNEFGRITDQTIPDGYLSHGESSDENQHWLGSYGQQTAPE